LKEKAGEFIECCLGHPALGILTALAGRDEAGPRKFLEVVRYRRLPNAQSLAQFPHTQAGAGVFIAVVLLAALREAQEDGQAMGMSQCLEGNSEFLNIHISIVIDLLLYVKAAHSQTDPSPINWSRAPQGELHGIARQARGDPLF
jgi:hypothetical protein